MLLEKQEVLKVLDRVNGKLSDDEVLKDMKVFFREVFSVEIMDYIADRIKDGRLRVIFIVWDVKTAMPFTCDYDHVYADKIKDRFSKACVEHGLNPDYYDPSDYFITVIPLKSEVEEILMTSENRKIISGILRKHPEVKRHIISGAKVFVFYAADKDIVTNSDNGLTTKIRDEICDVFKNVTGLNDSKLGDIRFSSLETMDGRYGGNFHGFWLDH